MSNIWHTTKEKPMLHRDIILCGDGWSMPIDIIPETVNNICWKNVEKWCYVDDLIKENDLTRKALDVAVDEITKIKVAAESVGIGFFMTAAIFALEKIKTALEQKEQQWQ